MPSIGGIYGQSPHSSSGIFGSTEGTPDTRLTAFSPDDARPLKVAIEGSTAAHAGTVQHDPFVTSTAKGKGEQKLSATASAFKPFVVPVPVAQPGPAIELTFPATAALGGKVQKLKDILNHVKSSQRVQQGDANQHGIFSTDTDITRCIQVKGTDSSVRQAVSTLLEILKIKYKLKGSERVETGINAAYLRYSDIRDASEVYSRLKGDLVQYSVEYILPAAFGEAVGSPSKSFYSAHEGQVVLTASYPVGTPYNKKAFEDALRAMLSAEAGEDGLNAWQKLAATEAGTFRMVAEFCDSTLARNAVQRLNGHTIKISRGYVTVSLELHTPDLSQSSQRLGAMNTPTRRSGEQPDVTDGLGRMSLAHSQTTEIQSRTGAFPTAVAAPLGQPYAASNASAFGLQTPITNGLPVMMGGIYGPAHIAYPHGCSTVIHHPYMGASNFNLPNPLTPGEFGHNNPRVVEAGFARGQTPSVAQGVIDPQDFQQLSFHQPSPQHNYGNNIGYPNYRSTSNYRNGDNYRDGSYFNRPSGRRQNTERAPHHRGRQYPNSAAGHHNHVDIGRIRQGIDVRTTVMLRNIPNKVDQAMLKEIVDESSFGRYDFMYLRIDFSNDCNVGYAFINFTDPLDIIDFVLARSNQKWHRFKSDKVAEVSYATIQGRDCLIQKFRNSSVMLEPPHYRPKLFFTIHDLTGRVGEEDQFPSSDNASKLKRSCENAEHVGLFAPNAGQHLRDEQRRRRSQFDRGTSLAEREEYGYNEAPSMHPGYCLTYY